MKHLSEPAIPYRDAFTNRTPHGAPTGPKADMEEQAVVYGVDLPSCLLEPDERDWLAPATSTHATSLDIRRQEALLHLAEIKLEDEKMAPRFKENDYLDRVRLFVRAGHPQALRLCACSYTGDWGGYPQVRRCNIANLCPCCSAIRHKKALLANVAAYHRSGDGALVTLSYHGAFEHGHIADVAVISELWAISSTVLKLAIKRGYFSGAFVSRELAVESLVPLRVMAHAHATVVASQLNLDELNQALIALMNEVNQTSALFSTFHVVPNVHIARYIDEGSMLRSVRYSMKTFGSSAGSKKPSLPDLYRSAQECNSPYVVNDSIRDLVYIFHKATHGKHRTSSLGALSHMAHKSLRVPKTKQHCAENRKIVQRAMAQARRSVVSEEIRELEEGL